MAHEITHKPAFLSDLLQLPKSVQKKISRAVEELSTDPGTSGTKKVFSREFANVFRYRIGKDYRLVFARGTGTICLLAVGHRSEIYERLQRGRAHVSVGQAEAVELERRTIRPAPGDRISSETFSEEDADASDLHDTNDAASVEQNDRPDLLPRLLDLWEVPSDIRSKIMSCRTPEDLFEVDLPEPYLELLVDFRAPPNVDQRSEQRWLELRRGSDLDRFVEGDLALTDFLLQLDPEQKRAANRNIEGPLLVSGSAGTGKSIVALYRIRDAVEGAGPKSISTVCYRKILFLTYTKALTRASEQLLKRLLPNDGAKQCQVKTLDAVATQIVGKGRRAGSRDSLGCLRRVRQSASDARHDGVNRGEARLNSLSEQYLLDEFDWVIDGRDIRSLDDYLRADRSGRKVGLGRKEREAVWKIYEEWKRRLGPVGPTFTQIQGSALREAKPWYDMVIVDEAQDLKPVGLRLALALCKDPKGFYLTADPHQSIYGRGYSWRRVSEDLDLRGRSVSLRRNYRNTRQIVEASQQFLRVNELSARGDQPEVVREGPLPICCAVGSKAEEADAIVCQFRRWSEEIQLPIWASAILVRSSARGKELAEDITRAGMKGEWIESSALELERRCVKVMSIHAAKGLEFPMVAVADVSDGSMPWIPSGHRESQEDEELLDLERRLFHVAMTRAMRRLIVTYARKAPSDFIYDLAKRCWTWTEGLDQALR